MREGVKALILPYEAPIISHFNHMCNPMILAHKAAPGFEGGAHHIAQRGIIEPTIASCEAFAKPTRSSLVIHSNPYNHLVPSRARRYSGIPTHRYMEREKSSGKSRDVFVFLCR
jgi:hypothetical protein